MNAWPTPASTLALRSLRASSRPRLGQLYVWSVPLALTQDDTWAAAMLGHENGDSELLTKHPMRHVLTNVLGARERTDAHVSEHDLRGGETLLLCSDGLYGALGEPNLAAIMRDVVEPEPLARRLVESALAAGARDNVTALVVRYEAES
jgi:protein phosphatase